MWVEGKGQLTGQLVVVSGPSGCGKSTMVRRALERPGFKERLQLSVSATTRSCRPGERNEVDYYFKDREDFEAGIALGQFLEFAEYNGNLYGTPAAPVYEALAAGKWVLLEIEVKGALQVREHAPGALFLFVKTPTFQILEERLRGRGTETDASLFRRLQTARRELAESYWYDHTLINDDLNQCVDEFLAVLAAHGCGG